MNQTGEQVVCPHCGMHYDYDAQRHCWHCDGAACPHCLGEHPDALCPECHFGPLPAHIEPMLARKGPMPDDLADWAFEYKWDGMRTLCYWQGGALRLENRNLVDVTARYPDLLATRAQMPARALILDGEIIATDDAGKPSFARLSRRMHAGSGAIATRARRYPVRYHIFDLLWADEASLVDRPYRERRRALEVLDFGHERWQVPASHPGEGPAMLRVAKAWELEGLMAKRLDAPYRVGTRSGDWRKIKLVRRQEFVIGGWEPRQRDAHQIGSLLIGYYMAGDPALRFAGRVGTGFDRHAHAMLAERLSRLARTRSPFREAPGRAGARYVRPQLVAEVGYRRWPPGGQLQQAAFLGLRDDVPPGEVVLEQEE
ncbi:MAG: non-homologous end-joining DNA ligase [Planctomycetota bacterium]